MKEKEALDHLTIVYEKMVQDYLDRGRFQAADDIWPLKDYRRLLELLRAGKWPVFGEDEQDLIGGVFGRYFGKGEFVSGYCPRIISYQEAHAASRALEWIARPFIK
jgi:hypothetical protein